MLQSYHRLQSKPETVSELKDAHQLILSAFLKKAIENAVKDGSKRLPACASQRWTFLTYNVIIHITGH